MIVSKNNNNISVKTIYLKITSTKIDVVSFFINVCCIMTLSWEAKSTEGAGGLLLLLCISILDTYRTANMSLCLDDHKIWIFLQFIDTVLHWFLHWRIWHMQTSRLLVISLINKRRIWNVLWKDIVNKCKYLFSVLLISSLFFLLYIVKKMGKS